MSVDAEEHIRQAARGSGTVFLAALDPEDSAIDPDKIMSDYLVEGYWDQFDDSNKPAYLEGSPRFTSVEPAIAWALARTSRVLISCFTPALGREQGKNFWAGEGNAPDSIEVW